MFRSIPRGLAVAGLTVAAVAVPMAGAASAAPSGTQSVTCATHDRCTQSQAESRYRQADRTHRHADPRECHHKKHGKKHSNKQDMRMDRESRPVETSESSGLLGLGLLGIL
jgi:Ni/Co efflux regulator RcnB